MESLKTKYRPKTLDEVVGNNKTVKTLKVLLEKKDRPHVYLFHGQPGTGKTTLARIISNMVNTSDFDCIEIDAASNSGIDDVRYKVIEALNTSPLNGPTKTIIIDEVQGLSKNAMDALLKTLEEPPSYGYVCLCTTDVKKLPKSLRSRCTQFEIEPITDFGEYADYVDDIFAKESKCTLTDNYVSDLLVKTEGSPRATLEELEKIVHLTQKELNVLKLEKEEDTIEYFIARELFNSKDWGTFSKKIKTVAVTDMEKIRYSVISYASSVLLNGSNKKAYVMLSNFINPFYNHTKGQFIKACYDTIRGVTNED